MARRDLTFRVFVSSTFSDLKAERNALQEIAFPRLRAYCQKKGARFQAIDLRWGVSEEAALDQQTMNICIQELKRCQVVSPRPNFIILLGERYGWQPLLPQIEASEFETLLEHVPRNQRPLLLEWYKRDENAVPPEYCLQPRKVDVGNAQTDQEKQAAHDAEAHRWSEQTEPFLHSLLLKATHEVFPDLEDPRRQKYEDSATHQEIRYGAFKAEDPQNHVFAYFRTIEGLPEDDSAKDFLDIRDGTIDGEVHDRLLALKRELQSLLPHEHVYDYIAQWRDGQPQSNLKALCDRVESDLRTIIDSELAAFQQAPELEREIKAHNEFGQQRAEYFVGRQEILEKIQAHVVGESNHPLVIHGVAGSGKTALMARAFQITEEAFPDAGAIFRFISATPSSSDGRSLLESLCHQIYEMFNFEEQKRSLLAQVRDTSEEGQKERQRIEEEYSIPSEYQKLSTTFRDFLTKIPKTRKLVLFLDALDQLSDTDHARSLFWLPGELPENVRLVVSCLPGECLSILQKRVPQQNIIELKPMPSKEGEKLLNIWLHNAGRTLQANQRSEILGKFQQCGLPLYLKLACEESRLWKSYTEKVELGPDVPDIIRNLLDRLSLDANHGHMMVSRSLGYLAAGKNGLTEDELLDVLSRDKEVISDFFRRSPKSPAVESLPVVVWSRLYFDLKPYLTERAADGTTLMTFYHRQLGEVVTEEFLAFEVRRQRHQRLAAYFAGQTLWTETEKKRNPNVRKVSELTYQQTYGELWHEIEKTLCDLHFIEAKCAAGMTYDLIHDYNVALDALPEVQPEKQQRLKHEARVKKYTEDLIAYAKGEIKTLDIIPSVEPWSKERIIKDTERIINNPTRLDKIRTFSQFVNSESHVLAKFSSHPGFVVQQAYNSASSGPVATAAEVIINTGVDDVLLLRSPSHRPEYNPHPALLRTLEGHPDDVESIAIAADGRKAISGGDYLGTVRVWSLDTGECLRTLKGHTRSINSISVTPDGATAVSGSDDGTIRVWNLDTGECLRILEEHIGRVTHVRVTPDGKTAISLSLVNSITTIRVWDLENGKCSLIINGERYLFYDVSITPDGRVAVSEDIRSGSVQVWDLESGQCLRNLQDRKHRLHLVSIMPDGEKVLLKTSAGTLQIFDLGSGGSVRTSKGDKHLFAGEMILTPDGETALCRGDDNNLGVLRIKRRREVKILSGHKNEAGCVAITPDGKRAVSGGKNLVRIWDVETGCNLMSKKRYEGSTEPTIITADGSRTLSGIMWFNLEVSDVKKGTCVRTFPGHTSLISSMSVTIDGRMAVSGSYDKTLRLWDLESGECLKVIEDSSLVFCTIFSLDGKTAISGNVGHVIEVWDLISRGCVRKFAGHTSTVTCLGTTPDGKHVVSGSGDGTLRLWNLSKGQCLGTLSKHGESVSAVKVTSDGKRVMSVGLDNTVRLWDLWNTRNLSIHWLDGVTTILSECVSEKSFVLRLRSGEIIPLMLHGSPNEIPSVTPIRIWLYGKMQRRLFEYNASRGHWDESIKTKCAWCDQHFLVSADILNVIRAINRNANLSQDQSPCLELPDEAWEEPQLLSECPICHKPLKYNPFIVDNKERY